MTLRGKVCGGVIIPEQGATLEEGAEVLIETFPKAGDELETAYEQLKAKLVTASENADSGEFFAPQQVLHEIDDLRRLRRTENK